MTCGFLPELLGWKRMFKYLMLHLIPFHSTTAGISMEQSIISSLQP